MKVFTTITWDIETLAILESQHCEYSGPIEKCCGATGAQQAAQANLTKVADLLRTSFQTIFGTNQNILSTLVKSLTPTTQAGPNAYGYSPAEDAARRTQATEQIEAGGRNATNATRNAVAGAGGMNLPSGSEAAVEAGLAQNQAYQEAGAQLGITEQGYEVGRENYFKSVSELAGAPGQLESPSTAAGNAATGAGSQQMQGANDIAAAQQAWEAPVAGIIGSVAKAAIPGAALLGANPLAPAGTVPGAGTFIDT